MRRGNRIKILGLTNRPQLDFLKDKSGIITKVLTNDQYEILVDDYLYLGIIKVNETELEKISAQ